MIVRSWFATECLAYANTSQRMFAYTSSDTETMLVATSVTLCLESPLFLWKMYSTREAYGWNCMQGAMWCEAILFSHRVYDTIASIAVILEVWDRNGVTQNLERIHIQTLNLMIFACPKVGNQRWMIKQRGRKSDSSIRPHLRYCY